MARPPESSTPSSRGLTDPQGQSKLELMPTETLDHIFSCLSHNEVLSSKAPDKHAIHANQFAQKNMDSLCLTSKRVDSVARPLLFRNITITSTPKLILLCGALQETIQLGSYIRQISFEITLGQMELWDSLTPPFSRDMGLLMNGFESAPGSVKRTISNLFFDHVLSSSFFEVLCRTPQVHHLVLRMQPTYIESGRARFSEGCRDSYRPFFDRVQMAMNSSRANGSTEFLPRLTTLQLLGDPKDPGTLFDIGICRPLLRIQTLETIITFRDNGRWPALVGQMSNASQPAQAFNNAKVAELQQNPCFCHDIRTLGILIPNIEVLRLSNRFVPTYALGTELQIQDEQSLSDGNGYLQEALVQMKNLHTLELDLQYRRNWDPRDDKPAPKNASLASLPKLATLKIPLAMLVMEHRRTDRNRIDGLKDVLPKSLNHLTVTVEVECPDAWWFENGTYSPTDPTWPPTSETGVLVFMEALSKLGHEAFPDLCEIVCCYRVNSHGSGSQFGGIQTSSADFEEEDLFEFSEVDDNYDPQRFELLRMSLQQLKWKFRVAYEDIHCSCWA